MPEESIATKERTTSVRPGLLFHGTSGFPVTEQLITEHGLLASTYTLTPKCEIALDHVTGSPGFLTFWYPTKKEIQRMSMHATWPSTLLPDETREEMRRKVEESDLHDFYKKGALGIIDQAKTMLPASKLGAIAALSSNDISWLNLKLPAYQSGFLENYTTRFDDLVDDVQKVLDRAEVKVFDPSLNNKVLSEHIVQTEAEHYLLGIGENLAFAKADEKRDKPITPKEQKEAEFIKQLEELRGVQFQEPPYERYRTMLISGLESYLDGRRID